jgi:hypothetical protein
VGQLDKALAIARALLSQGKSSGRTASGFHGGVPIRFLVEPKGWRVIAAAGPLFTVGTIRPRVPRLWRYGHVFERSFSVPEAVAPMLDGSLRERLVMLRPHQVRLSTDGVELEKRYAYYYAEAEDIALAIGVVAELARHAREQATIEEAQIRARIPVSGPFRAGPDLAAADFAVAARLDELRQSERRGEPWWRRWLALVLVVLVTTSVYAVLH